MAERFTKDTGMMQRNWTKYRLDDPADRSGLQSAFEAWNAAIPVAMPGDWIGDALRRENAERCRAIVETVGLTDDGTCGVDTAALRDKGLAENSAQWIAAHWLAEYNALVKAKERVIAGDASPGNLGRMLLAAEEMGRLQERLWWRAGVDPETRERRETLALERKKSRLALAKNSERNHERQLTAQLWLDVAQPLADAYWRRRPGASKSETAQAVLRDWPTDDDAPTAPGISSIRQKIYKPRKT